MKTLIAALLLSSSLPAYEAVLDPAKVRGPISDLAYGSNQPLGAKTKLMRHGGNRYTGYNWEANTSNAGHDWKHNSDTWLNTTVGLPDKPLGPAAIPLHAVAKDKAAGRWSILTVPMAGYVAADNAGPVGAGEKAPSRRWVKVQARKGKPFTAEPDLRDGVVYVDEFVDYLKRKNSLPLAWCLDNEPGLWPGTHPRIHPQKPTYDEVVEKSVAAASAILDVDPQARIAGAVTYGWAEIMKLQDAPDMGRHNPAYGSYLGYFLAKMKEASTKQKRPLLHMLDNHWYPEARGGGKRITEAKDHSDRAVVQARLQAPRSLWDPSYTEDSWITRDAQSGPIRLIPRVKEIIDRHYPGVQPAFLEWNYGGHGHISGGLASADVLGIFGRYNAAACFWHLEPEKPIPHTDSAFKLYLDFDGRGSRFGDTSLEITSPDHERLSLHAAKDAKNPKRLTLVAVHKDLVNSGDLNLKVAGAAKVRAYRMEGKKADLKAAAPQLTPAGVSDKLPPLSATVYEIILK